MTHDAATPVAWAQFLRLRRASVVATAAALGMPWWEERGLLVSAAPADHPARGSVLAYEGTTPDRLREVLGGVRPEYVQVPADLPELVAAAARTGYADELGTCAMHADATRVAELPLPDGVVRLPRLDLREQGTFDGLATLTAEVEGVDAAEARAWCEDLARLDDLVVSGAAADGLLVGSAAVRLLGGLGYVMVVQTLPQHRRRGIGGALVSRTVRDTAARGVRDVFLVATEEGRGVYRRAGFTDVRLLRELLPPSAG